MPDNSPDPGLLFSAATCQQVMPAQSRWFKCSGVGAGEFSLPCQDLPSFSPSLGSHKALFRKEEIKHKSLPIEYLFSESEFLLFRFRV